METSIKNFFKNLDVRFKTIFISVVVFLFLAHGMAIFNKYSFNDDIWLFGLTGIESARWGLDVLSGLFVMLFGKFGGSSVYSMPIIHIFYVVIFLSGSLYLMVKLLDIKSLLSCVLLSGLFMTSFFFTSLFGYMFTSAPYILAMFLSVLGVYFMCSDKTRKNFWYAVICLVLSLSIYQSFLPVSLSLVLMFFVKNTLDKKSQKSKEFFKEGFYYLFSFTTALVLYFIIVKLSLFLGNKTLSSYQNIANMGQLGIVTYLKSVLIAYFKFFFPTWIFLFNTKYLHKFILIVFFIFVYNKAKELSTTDKNKFYQFVLLNFLFPLTTTFVYVMVGYKENVHILMLVGLLMLFPYLLFLFENVRWKNIEKIKNIGYISLCLMVLMFIRCSNVFYLKAEFMQARSKSYFTTLISQIKNTKGYKDEYSVVFLNEFNKKDDSVKELAFPTGLIPYDNMKDLINSYSWKEFLDKWLAYRPKYESPEKFEKLPEVKAMPHYPDYGSIKIINKTIVVKF